MTLARRARRWGWTAEAARWLQEAASDRRRLRTALKAKRHLLVTRKEQAHAPQQ